MKPTNGRWWPEKAPWEGGGRVPCRRRGRSVTLNRPGSRQRLKTQETPLGLGVPTSCSDGTEEGDVGPI